MTPETVTPEVSLENSLVNQLTDKLIQAGSLLHALKAEADQAIPESFQARIPNEYSHYATPKWLEMVKLMDKLDNCDQQEHPNLHTIIWCNYHLPNQNIGYPFPTEKNQLSLYQKQCLKSSHWIKRLTQEINLQNVADDNESPISAIELLTQSEKNQNFAKTVDKVSKLLEQKGQECDQLDFTLIEENYQKLNTEQKKLAALLLLRTRISHLIGSSFSELIPEINQLPDKITSMAQILKMAQEQGNPRELITEFLNSPMDQATVLEWLDEIYHDPLITDTTNIMVKNLNPHRQNFIVQAELAQKPTLVADRLLETISLKQGVVQKLQNLGAFHPSWLPKGKAEAEAVAKFNQSAAELAQLAEEMKQFPFQKKVKDVRQFFTKFYQSQRDFQENSGFIQTIIDQLPQRLKLAKVKQKLGYALDQATDYLKSHEWKIALGAGLASRPIAALCGLDQQFVDSLISTAKLSSSLAIPVLLTLEALSTPGTKSQQILKLARRLATDTAIASTAASLEAVVEENLIDPWLNKLSVESQPAESSQPTPAREIETMVKPEKPPVEPPPTEAPPVESSPPTTEPSHPSLPIEITLGPDDSHWTAAQQFTQQLTNHLHLSQAGQTFLTDAIKDITVQQGDLSAGQAIQYDRQTLAQISQHLINAINTTQAAVEKGNLLPVPVTQQDLDILRQISEELNTQS